MSKCKICNNPTEWYPRRNKYKMYCSRKCANNSHHKKTYKKKNPDWGSKGKKTLKEKQERKEQFEWYSENWLTVPQVAEILDLGLKGSVYSRTKRNGVKGKIINGRAFYNPEDIEKLKTKITPIPDGYLTRNRAAEYLGMPISTFAMQNKTDLPFIEFQETHGFKSKRILYKPSDLDKWNKERLENRAKEAAENKRLRSEAAQKRREEKKRLEKEARKVATQGLIGSTEAAKRLGVVGISGHVRRGNLVPVKKIRKAWFNPADVEVLRLRLEKERQEREENGPYVLVIKRNDNYTSVKAYEDKLFNIKIPKMLKNNPDQARLEAIALNNTYHNDRTQRGFVHKLECNKCNKMLPYTSFGWASSKYRGRQSNCKVCASLINKSKYNSNAQKQNWKAKTPKQKFRTIIGTQIKQDISRQRGQYAKDLSIPEIWEHIESSLGYSDQDFCDHLEAQFDPNMTWNNHGRGKHAYHWQIDHIVPRSEFKYKSLNDPDFFKCWSLENIRPLEANDNIVRYFKNK